MLTIRCNQDTIETYVNNHIVTDSEYNYKASLLFPKFTPTLEIVKGVQEMYMDLLYMSDQWNEGEVATFHIDLLSFLNASIEMGNINPLEDREVNEVFGK